MVHWRGLVNSELPSLAFVHEKNGVPDEHALCGRCDIHACWAMLVMPQRCILDGDCSAGDGTDGSL